jgi:hypothetical protein
MGPDLGMKPEDELNSIWLRRETEAWKFYADLRDKYMPGKPMWLTETGQAGCGGDRFAAQFADSFRYAHQLGTLAQKGVKVVVQNTLASSDYGLLNEDTLEPRPNYWLALLWKKLMGTVVLDPGVPATNDLDVYAHCAKDTKGGVAVAVTNFDTKQEQVLFIPARSERYTLSAAELSSTTVLLNGTALKVGNGGEIPKLSASPAEVGNMHFAPLTITFLTFANAGNAACSASSSSI